MQQGLTVFSACLWRVQAQMPSAPGCLRKWLVLKASPQASCELGWMEGWIGGPSTGHLTAKTKRFADTGDNFCQAIARRFEATLQLPRSCG